MDAATILNLGDKIRPLHQKKLPNRPGDWLESHPERGQTVEEYTAGNPNIPTAQHTTMYILPLGDLDEAQKKLINDTAEMMGIFYGVPIKKLDPLGMDAIPAEARRVHPQWGDKQILSTCVLEMLKSKRPKDAISLIALTATDLWPGQGWNFVFGQASPTDRVGVWSLHRFGDPQKDYNTVLRRTLRTAIHETGHMLGIAHCTAYECGMNGSNNLDESDRRPLAFCPEDEMKVWWACKVDPARRYDALATFAHTHGLEQEEKLWKASADAVRK
jgi:archaemetzincin